MHVPLVHLVISPNHNNNWLDLLKSIKAVRWCLQRRRLVVAVCSELAPTSTLSLSPKNLYLLHDAWKHTVFSYNFSWPLTPSAQMQYDLAATIHFGLWSRFNEFLLCSMCMSLALALSFDPHCHQCLEKTSLGTPKWRCWAIAREMFSFMLCVWIWCSENLK